MAESWIFGGIFERCMNAIWESFCTSLGNCLIGSHKFLQKIIMPDMRPHFRQFLIRSHQQFITCHYNGKAVVIRYSTVSGRRHFLPMRPSHQRRYFDKITVPWQLTCVSGFHTNTRYRILGETPAWARSTDRLLGVPSLAGSMSRRVARRWLMEMKIDMTPYSAVA